MTISIFKSKWKYYKVWIAFTGTLKKTKKDCWIDYKRERSHYQAPAKLTPKIISETYDAIKKFLDDYYEPMKDQWYYRVIRSTSDKAEYTFHARCVIDIKDKDWETIYSSNNHMNYWPRRRLCLAFFDDVKCYNQYDEQYCVDVISNEMFNKWDTDTHLTSWDVITEWEVVIQSGDVTEWDETLSETIPF